MFSSINYHYVAAGQLIELASRFADAETPDRTVKSEYDKYGRLARVVYDDSRTEEYTRDTWGKILKVTATDGETVRESTLTYDYFDRLIEQVETVDGKLAVSNQYTYNAYGQRVLRETQTPLGPQTETREYDQFGRLVLIESGSGKVEYQYNNLNQVATRTANGIPVVYTYTAQGQLQSKTLGDGIATQEYFYSPSGRLIARADNGERVDYTYDAKGQLLAVVNAAGEAIECYAYDPAGNILEKTVDGETTTFTYDAANQLVTSVKDGETTTFQYDAAGRLVKSGATEYSYGWMDKVLSITENESVTKEVSYYLNGQVAQVNDLSNQSVESFTWDGLALIQRNAISYLNEPAVTGGNPILADGKALFEDHLGSSAGVYSDGEYQAIERTAFGEVKENTDFNFYTGKPEIEGLGYAFLFRNYQAGTGKWLTTDPMGYPDGWNNLAYVNNWVIGEIDTLGLCTQRGVWPVTWWEPCEVHKTEEVTKYGPKQNIIELVVSCSSGIGAEYSGGLSISLGFTGDVTLWGLTVPVDISWKWTSPSYSIPAYVCSKEEHVGGEGVGQMAVQFYVSSAVKTKFTEYECGRVVGEVIDQWPVEGHDVSKRTVCE